MRGQARTAACAIAVGQPRRQSCRRLEPSRRPDLGSRQPVSLLQGEPILRAARGRLQRGARRCQGRCRRTSSGAPSARSTIPTARTPRRPTAARRPPASAISRAARLGGADLGRDLLREQRAPAPLRERVRAQIFLGHGEGRLRPAGSARRLSSASRRSSSRVSAATASGPGSRARPEARGDAARTVRGQAHHRARALRVRSQFRRLGHRQAARRPRACRARGGGRGPLHRRAR